MGEDFDNSLTEDDRRFMRLAIELAGENIDNGGGPYGAVIVRNGEMIAAAGNSVLQDNDPTAHAEVNAIRLACRLIGDIKLDGCVIYCSSEPCLMCLSALYWAGVSRIYYANISSDATHINFIDEFIYKEIDKPQSKRHIPCIHIEDSSADDLFKKWATIEDKIEY